MEPSNHTTDPPGHGPRNGDSRRILVVEDVPLNRKVIGLMLTNIGFEWAVAHNGQDALEMLATQPFALILMDCQMPLMDGFEATRRIRSGHTGVNPPDLPIIALTANAMNSDRQECLAAGMTDYLTKPILKNDLEQVLKRHLLFPSP